MVLIGTRTKDQIWADDVFNRFLEAEQLEGYIESVLGRPPYRDDKKAYTIAIDGGYGAGKTFFLKRFAEHLALNHPVAFVDAWADDLADEPLTALAATLQEALKPYVDEPTVTKNLHSFIGRTGEVVKIAGKGLARRGLTLLLTGGAVDQLDGVLNGATDAVREAVEGATANAADGFVADVTGAIGKVTAHELMEKRVAEFNEGRDAVRAMKESLSAIVASLRGRVLHPPIVIVIDELDRCRPTYAIKLLEEIKHLFDVPGIVFILGIHGDQLAHSISGAYGINFDGRAYLRRFIDREYNLALPDLAPLLMRLCEAAGLDDTRIIFPSIINRRSDEVKLPNFRIIAEYMQKYDLHVRDAFALVDILQTTVAFARNVDVPLFGAYLLPLAIGQVKGLPVGALPEIVRQTEFDYYKYDSKVVTRFPFEVVALDFKNSAMLSSSEIIEQQKSDVTSWGVDAIFRTRPWAAPKLPLWDVTRYPELLTAVGRFTNPHMERDLDD